MLETGVLRPLGGAERFFHKYSQRHPSHFVLVAALESDAPLSVLRLRAAVQVVQSRHPLLSSAIREVKDAGPAFVASGARPDLKVFEEVDPDAWEGIAQAELSVDFHVEQGPLWRVSAILHPERPVLILTFHHAAADALAGVAVAKDLVAALQGQALVERPIPDSLNATLADLFPNQIGMEPEVAAAQRAALAGLADQPVWRAFAQDRSLVSKAIVDEAVTAGLIDACRTEGATLQGLLCAAFAVAQGPQADGEPVVVVTPISYRQGLGRDEDDCVLLIAAAPIAVDSSALDRVWPSARRYSQALREHRPVAAMAPGASMLEALIDPRTDPAVACGVTASMQTAGSVSNLGVIDLGTQAGAVRLKAIWGPLLQARLIGERIIGVTSQNGRLHLTETIAQSLPSTLADIAGTLRAALNQVSETELI